jgi:hypothetical protein
MDVVDRKAHGMDSLPSGSAAVCQAAPTERKESQVFQPRLTGSPVEYLERRILCAKARAPVASAALEAATTIQVVIDYSLDTHHFFDTQTKRELLQQAADSVVKWFRDDLAALAPTATDSWDAVIDHPGTGEAGFQIANPTIDANQVVIFAGGRDMADALGRGGPGGYTAKGSQAWLDRVARRGQTARSGGVEFGPWGGAITFDTNPASPWHFGETTAGLDGSNDFLSVATHEVAHLFGFGTADAWRQFTSGQRFTGPAAVALYDGNGDVPLTGDGTHWAEGTRDDGVGVAMDPQLTVGTRRLLVPLDYAGLDDIGWSMPPRVDLASGAVAAGGTNHTFTVTYSHYTDMNVGTVDASDVTVMGPNGSVFPAVAAGVQPGGDGRTLSVAYAIAPPGGVWDAADNGAYSVVLGADQVRSSTGEAVAAGTIGTFAANLADVPVGQLQPVADPSSGSASHDIRVAYTDAVGIDPAGIDAGDILVTGPGGGAVAVTAAAVDSAVVGTPRVATYTLAAPGGTWGSEDDGVYTVMLRADQVRDADGNGSVGTVVGVFEVSLGAIRFDARTPAAYVDASGDVVRVSMKGPGNGRVRFLSARPADAVGITLDGTTAGTTLTIKAAGAGTPTGTIVVNGPIKSISGKTADLTGDLTVAGTLGALRVRSAAAGHKVSATLVGAITAVAWDADVSADVIGKLKAATLGGDLLAGSMIGTVAAKSISGSRIYAGVRTDFAGALPALATDFAKPGAIVRGVVAKNFGTSFVAAPTIGKLSLGVTASGGAAANRILSAAGRSVMRPFRYRNVEAPGEVFRDEGAGELFVIRVI